MKKQIITIGLIAMISPISNGFCANALYCFTNTLPNSSDCPDCTKITKTISCDTKTYCDCSECKNNETPIDREIQTGQNTYTTISECPKSAIIIGGACPDECPSSLTWSDVSGQNYQTKCDGSRLNPQCEYQCKAGYYGTGKDCTRCPAVDNTLSSKQYGTSTPGSNTTITGCFLPPGTYYDATGTFTIGDDNCSYIN